MRTHNVDSTMQIREIHSKISALKPEQSLFIACAGFEPRSTAILRRLGPSYQARFGVIFCPSDYAEKGNTPSHLAFINKQIESICSEKPIPISFEASNPIEGIRKFEKVYREWCHLGLINNVTVDISVMPRQELIMLMRVLESVNPKPRIHLFYSEPLKYATEKPDGWLTRGVTTVRSVPGFGGIQPPGKKKLLILFLGHEDERASITWKRHQPNKTVAIIPEPSYRSGLFEITREAHHLLFKTLEDAIILSSVPARGIVESMDAVLKLWTEYSQDYYLVVAPFSTKLQSLGVYRAAQEKRDIQITYAHPSIYNFKDYSSGQGRIWEILWIQ